MLLLLIVIVFLYYVFIFYMLVYWRSITTTKENGASPFVSILIPIRNEQNGIARTLRSILANDYPRSKYEIWVVDDHSTDDSKARVLQLCKLHDHVKYVALAENKLGKKEAITTGIARSKGAFILCTDGDTVVSQSWIGQHASTLSTGAAMAFGPVMYEGGENRFIQNLLNLELIGLVGIGAATLQMGRPSMINGCNYSFCKSAFLEVGGFDQNLHIPTGDDEFLLRKIHKQFSRVQFLKSKNAIVKTNPISTISEFYNQRRRWASKWKAHQDKASRVLAVLVFSFYLMLILSLYFSVQAYPTVSLGLMLTKAAVDYFFLKSVAGSVEYRIPIFEFLTLQIIYPFYVVFFGFASNFGRYGWKERSYKI